MVLNWFSVQWSMTTTDKLMCSTCSASTESSFFFMLGKICSHASKKISIVRSSIMRIIKLNRFWKMTCGVWCSYILTFYPCLSQIILIWLLSVFHTESLISLIHYPSHYFWFLKQVVVITELKEGEEVIKHTGSSFCGWLQYQGRQVLL